METWSCSHQANCSATAAVCHGFGMQYHVVLHNSSLHAGHHDYHVPDYPHVTLGPGEYTTANLASLGFPDNSECPSGWYCDFISGYTQPVCHRDECVESQCLPSCTSTDDCARGFECVDVYGDGLDVVCYADCEFLNEEGLLP